jgi:hypothetical protein
VAARYGVPRVDLAPRVRACASRGPGSAPRGHLTGGCCTARSSGDRAVQPQTDTAARRERDPWPPSRIQTTTSRVVAIPDALGVSRTQEARHDPHRALHRSPVPACAGL